MNNILKTIIIATFLFCTIKTTYSQISKNDSLLDAAWANDIELVKKLVLSGADVNCKAYNGTSPLHYACANNNMDMARIFILKKADINSCDNELNTPLIICATTGNAYLGEYLVKQNAEKNLKNIYGKNALYISCENEDFVFADMLLYYGASPDILTNDSSSAMHIATIKKNTELIELLLQNKANPNIANIYNSYPAYYAFLNDDTTSFILLTQNGALFDSKGSTIGDAVSLAIQYRLPNMLKYLIQDPTLSSDKNAQKLYDKAILSDDCNNVKTIKSLGLKGSGRPIFSGVHLLSTFYTSFRDFYGGLTVGTREMKTNIFLNVGFTHRFGPKKLLYEDSNSNLLQLREHRGLANVNVGKGFIMAQKRRTKFMLIPGVTFYYTWAKYDGMRMEPYSGWKVLPNLEATLISRHFYTSLSYTYLDFNNNLPSSFFQLKCGWTIPFKYEK